MIIAADVAQQLSKLVYHELGIKSSSDDLPKVIKNKCSDIVMMNLKKQNKVEWKKNYARQNGCRSLME